MKKNYLTKVLGGALSVLLMLSTGFVGCHHDSDSGSEPVEKTKFSSKTETVKNDEDTLGLVATAVESSDESVVTVTLGDNGISIVSKKAGETTVKAIKGENTAIIKVTVAEDGTITTVVNKYSATYTVKFDVNGGTGTFDDVIVDDGSPVSKPETDPTKDHSVFLGWYSGDTEFDFDTAITSNTTLYANWAKDKHTVTFDLNGAEGTVPDAKEVECESEIELPSYDSFKKEGFSCLGWAVSQTEEESGLKGNVTVSEDITYYLAWTTKSTYEVIFKVDGSVYNTAKVVEGGKVTAPNAPAKDGYAFNGWKLGEVAYDFNTPVTSSIELTAAWELIEYTITYIDEKNGSIASGEKVAVYTIESSTIALSVLEKDGYTFCGWKNSLGETVTSIPAGSTGNITLTAAWTLTYYKITYELNGGTNAASNPEEYTIEDTITFASATKERYAFDGWTPASIAKGSTGKITVTASWKEIPVTSVVVSGSNTVKFGATAQLKAVVTPSTATATEVTWASSNTSIATVSNTGLVTAGNSEGTTNITATVGGVTSQAFTVTVVDPSKVELINITKQGGWLESSYVEWAPVKTYNLFNVYVQKSGSSTWDKLDDQLIRSYSATAGGTTVDHWRADALGLAAGTYTMKVVGADDSGKDVTASAATSTAVEVKAHDRTGFAHSNWNKGIGAYTDDGVLKAGAKVLYVTKDSAKTVKMTVKTGSKDSNKEEFTGIQAILDAYQKGYETTPLAIRFVGFVTKDNLDKISSSEEGLQIKGKAENSEMNITIEGVGNDATITGFGFLIRNCKSVEVRNLGIFYCLDDCVSIDTGNSNLWVHNMDFFYGPKGSGDHAKGDGALDTKGTMYATHSYNHFWDTGKTHLNSNGDKVDFVTYHHNWYDHSDSRHPRVRVSTAVHVYNNYFDGNSKYGSGATTGSSIFVENNYFRDTDKPILISMQGSDINNSEHKGTFSSETGGMIKAWNNTFVETSSNFKYVTYQQDNVEFDAYEASSRDEKVPESVKTKSGNTSYSNFDTASTMYACNPDTPETAKANVMKYSGRMEGGDIQFTFDNSKEDHNYALIPELEALLKAYNSKIVKIQGDGVGGGDDPTPPTPGVPSVSISGTTTVTVDGTTTLTATASEISGTVTYTWTTTSASVTLTPNGEKCTVTGVSEGSATVTVTATNGTDSATSDAKITVNPKQTTPTPSGITYPTTAIPAGTYAKGTELFTNGYFKSSTLATAVADNTICISPSEWVSFKLASSAKISFTSGNKGAKIIAEDGTVKLAQSSTGAGSVTLEAGNYYITSVHATGDTRIKVASSVIFKVE